MDNTKLKQLILKVLKKDERLWNEDKTELNQTLLLDLVEKIDETVIDLLLQEKDLREKFFVKIKDVYVFKTNDFRFFMEENKVDNSYTAYKNKIGLTDSKKFLKDTNDVVLDFPYKDCVLEGGQSTEEGEDVYFEYDETVTEAQEKQGLKADTYNQKTAKRKEIFFNSVLAHDEIDRLFDHKALTNWKRFTKDGEQEIGEIKRNKDGIIKENLIIKGNNLLALHSLKKQFAGKVKLIYIDPPYNTGNDGFKYNDNFSYSTWLTFMKNRLEIGKQLLRDDGSILINIDDKEAHYLKILVDDIFGRENFVANLVWQRAYAPVSLNKFFSQNHDHIFIFSKNIKEFKINKLQRSEKQLKDYKNPDNDIRGKWKLGNPSVGPAVERNIYEIITPSGRRLLPPKGRSWLYSKEKFEQLKKDNRIWFGIDGNSTWGPKLFLNEVSSGITPFTLWEYKEVGHTQDSKKELKKLFADDVFSSPKPETLIQRIIYICSDNGDIVLDYHLGSGTTAAVAHKMGRQYIGIEQMDYVETIAVERLKKVIQGEQGGISKSVNWQGGGDFIYFELAKWNETAKEKIFACESLEELETFFDEMYERYFLNYNLKIKEFKEKVLREENFRKLPLDDQKKIFVAMLDNNQMYVNKTEMADKKFGISEEDQRLTEEFYNSEK